MTYYTKHVFLCTNQKGPGKQCCATAGGEDFFNYLKSKLKDLNLHGPGAIRISKSGCLGRCAMGPCLVIYPEGTWYSYKSYADIDLIIEQALVAGHSVPELLLAE